LSIAFFDFDGTITKSDSLKHFLLFYFKPLQLLSKSLLFFPHLLNYLLGRIDNSTAKEKLFLLFFKGCSIEVFNQKCHDFARQILTHKQRKEAKDRIQWHLNRGDKVVIVSASIQNYLIPLFEKENIPVLSTKLDVVNQQLTGLFSTPNCYGKEKKKRVLAEYDLSSYNEVFAYGDSNGDKYLFELASKVYYKKFN